MRTLRRGRRNPIPVSSGIADTSLRRSDRGFTLIELVLVIVIIAALTVTVSFRSGYFSYWQEEGGLRKISELLVFLHHQAVSDQKFYRIEFDLETQSYRVGALVSENSTVDLLVGSDPDAGNLTLELAAFLSPAQGDGELFIPPPSFPSLAEPTEFPVTLVLEDIRTVRGVAKAVDKSEEKPFLVFSPRGFSEFGVLHFRDGDGKATTIFVNPWTGLTEVYREYKDFEWSFKKDKKQ